MTEQVVQMPDRTIRVTESRIDPRDYPVPTGYRLLVEPIHIEEKTASGLLLPAQAVEAKEHLRSIGRVVALGPLAYCHDKFEDQFGQITPWCGEGDWVVYNTYAGHEVRIRNKSGHGYTAVRLINDDEVMARINDPTSVLIYA